MSRNVAMGFLPTMAQSPAGGEYASVAGFAEAYALYSSGDKDGYYKSIRAYIADYPNVPYYSEEARLELARRLYRDRKYDEALEALQDCRECWERSSIKEVCETLKRHH